MRTAVCGLKPQSAQSGFRSPKYVRSPPSAQSAIRIPQDLRSAPPYLDSWALNCAFAGYDHYGPLSTRGKLVIFSDRGCLFGCRCAHRVFCGREVADAYHLRLGGSQSRFRSCIGTPTSAVAGDPMEGQHHWREILRQRWSKSTYQHQECLEERNLGADRNRNRAAKDSGRDQTIGELLPAETRGLDSVKRSITVGQLLSMRAGLQPTSFGNYGAWVTSSNWVRNALSRPLVDEPGGRMLYSTGSTHLLSAILTRATGTSTFSFANQNLARPLGITLRPWQRDPQGIFFGGNDMYLTPREMLRFGNLYLRRGQRDGKQIIPASWIDSSFVARTTSPFNGNSYGYGWWKRSAQGHDIHYAWGYGGQFIFVVPSRRAGGCDDQRCRDSS